MAKIGMVSLGCPKNQVDAEILFELLREAGHELVEDVAYSDIAIVNTCGFIESAKQESIEEILELAKLKNEGRIKGIIATGCLAERYRDELANEIPELDAVVGIGANVNIAQAVEEVLDGGKLQIYGEKTDLPLNGKRVRTTPFYYSYIKIAEGCDNRCSYCAIPLIRGGFRSRKMEDIIEEAKTLVGNGVKELNVIAQDTTRYGEDIYGKLMLPELLKELCKIDGVEWIRVLYCYPDRITDELLDVMASEDKIVKYIDLPLQHANGEVLKAMNRRGDYNSLTAIIKKIRSKIPDVVIRTTMIVGFPGETKKQFGELAEFVKESKFERLGCFVYSEEEGTPAAEFEGKVSAEDAEHRFEIIMNEQMRISDRFNQKQVGKALDVLVEGFDRIAECWFGRTRNDAPEVDGKVFFTCENRPHEGEIIKVKITEFMDYDLVGERVE